MKTSPTRSAFTLIEMLVVMAIIVLLVSLMLPVIARARESAKNAVCMANLHEVGTAIGAYTAEREGKLPTAGHFRIPSQYNRDQRYFQNQLRTYLGLRESDTWSTSATVTTYSKVFHCPSYKGPKGGNGYQLQEGVRREDGTTFNPWGRIGGPPSYPIFSKPFYLDQIPANTWAIRDLDYNAANPSHRKHRNALFFDFSVRRLDMNNNPL